MYERMFGDALHRDRLTRARENMRLQEAGQANRMRRTTTARGRYRYTVAKALIGLATRIAPAVTVPRTSTNAAAR